MTAPEGERGREECRGGTWECERLREEDVGRYKQNVDGTSLK